LEEGLLAVLQASLAANKVRGWSTEQKSAAQYPIHHREHRKAYITLCGKS